MATNVLMPALSPTMTEGTLSKWLKKEGETVKSGDVIAEIETDKATMEVEAVDEGILGKILVAEGTDGVAVNAPIAVLVDKGEKVPSEAPAAAAPKPGKRVEETAEATPAPQPRTDPRKDPEAAAPKPAAKHEDRIVASPLARRMAEQAGLDLASLKGSGPDGRIVKADIEAARGKSTSAARAEEVPAPRAAPASVAKATDIAAPHDAIPHSTMRKVIAKRMVESTQAIPVFYLSIDVELDALLKLRADLNAQAPKDGPGAFKLSVNDLVIKAVAVALRRHPEVNASYTDDAMIRYRDVDISVAVAIPDGLITPIIRQADRKGLAAISNEMRELSARAKEGKLKPEEFQGGTFSISNLGMYGMSHFTAIINPPQSAILAIGAGDKRAVVRDGQLAVATVMTVTMSCDHRVMDGATGAEFVATFKKIVESPLSLML